MNTLTSAYLPQQGLLPNYFQQAPGQQPLQMQTLCLNQVEGFEPVKEFRDQSNTLWSLVKAASNSTVGIPDPKSLQIVDYWNHSFCRTSSTSMSWRLLSSLRWRLRNPPRSCSSGSVRYLCRSSTRR